MNRIGTIPTASIRRIRAALLAAGLACAGAVFAQATTAPPAQPAAAQPRAAARDAPANKPAASLRAEPVPPQVDAAFKAFDTDRNGSLSLAEFRAGWQTMRRGGAQTVQSRLQRQFEQLDANGNGGIDRTEYSNMVLVRRAGGAAPPFSEFDRDGSQKLEFAEYAALVQRLATRPTAAPTTPPRK